MPASTLEIRTSGPGLYELTDQLERAVASGGVSEGVLVVFVRHTSASLLIQENADPSVLQDLLDFFERVAPQSSHYAHDTEGPDDMPAHIRAALTRSSETIPISGGRLGLGPWQGVFLFEHRQAPHLRRVELRLVEDR